jgi:undecaprenyl-diphosphatase
LKPLSTTLSGLSRHIETRLLLAFLVIATGIAAFAALTDEVREGGLLGIDRTLLLVFRVPGHPDVPSGPLWVQEAARDVTALGGFTVLTLVSISATTLLWLDRRRLQAVVFALTVMLAQGLSQILKTWIDRPRPTLVHHLDLVYSSSFPSGHAMMAPVVYLTLTSVLVASPQRLGQKTLLIGVAIMLTAAIGVSRVYLGVHWPTDVLGGWCLGSVVALGAVLALQYTRPK